MRYFSPDEGGGDASGGEPWYQALSPSQEDIGILSKYKTQAEALKAGISAQHMIGKMIALPDSAKLKPEEVEASHRDILGKLGAPKEAKEYGLDKLRDKLPESVRASFTDDVLQTIADDWTDAGVLPWQVKSMWARMVKRIESGLAAKPERDRAAEVERIQSLQDVLGPKYELAIKDGEAAAMRLDNALLAEQNSKLKPEEIAEKGGVLTQALRKADSPVIWRAFQHLYDRLFAEGPGSPQGTTGPATGGVYQDSYNEAKAMWPNRGAEIWTRYAKEKAGMPR